MEDQSPCTLIIEYSINGGADWTAINGGSYSNVNDAIKRWTLPVVDSARCLVRINVTDSVGLTATNQSSDLLIIYAPYPRLTIQSPSPGTVIRAGSSNPIVWQSANGVGTKTVTIQYSTSSKKEKWAPGMELKFPEKMLIRNKIDVILEQKVPLELIIDPEVSGMLESPVGLISKEILEKIRHLNIPEEELN